MKSAYVNDDTLFIWDIESDAGCGRSVKYVIVTEDLLWHKNFRDVFYAAAVVVQPLGGQVKVMMNDCTLRDITIMLPHIWEERRRRKLDND